MILRRYTANWAVPDDRKINPWDHNQPDPRATGGTIPGPTLECAVGEEFVVHFRNKDQRAGASLLDKTHSLHPHGVTFHAVHDGAYPLSPPDHNQPVDANSFAFTIREGTSFMGAPPEPAAGATGPGSLGEWHMRCHVHGHMLGGMMGSLLIVQGGEVAGRLPRGTTEAASVPVSVPPGTVHEVSIHDTQFDPTSFDAKMGDVVCWTNNDVQDHTVTSDSGSPQTFDRGPPFAQGTVRDHGQGDDRHHLPLQFPSNAGDDPRDDVEGVAMNDGPPEAAPPASGLGQGQGLAARRGQPGRAGGEPVPVAHERPGRSTQSEFSKPSRRRWSRSVRGCRRTHGPPGI